jgi:hypothetical protein
VSGTPQERRNPLRLIVSKETQLHILWLVAGGLFIAMAGTVCIIVWVRDWVWVAALALALGSFLALWISRTIAGPFYRIEKDLEAVLSNGVQGKQISLRPGDPLQHLAALVNELISRSGQQSNPK